MRRRDEDTGDAPRPGIDAPLAWVAAISMFTGAHLAWWVSRLTAHPTADHRPDGRPAWLTASAVTVVGLAWAVRASNARRSVACAAFAAGALLALSADGSRHAPWPDDGPVTIEGTVITQPRPVDEGCDRLARWIVREAAQTFRLRATGCIVDGARSPCDAEVGVRVAGLDPLPARGSTIRVRGWLSVDAVPAFPGAGTGGTHATIRAGSSSLVSERGGDPDAVRRVRACANAALVGSLPPGTHASTVALVAAMTTGIRLHGLDAPSSDFRFAGMSHVLAISGFNVAVLVAAAAGVAHAAGAGTRTRACVAILVALAFLALTEPETSVLRAGWGAVVAAVAAVRGGNARGLGTLGAVACATMMLDVDAARAAGFCLSFGTVAALLALTPVVVARWRPRTERWLARTGAPEPVRIAVHAVHSAAVQAAVAWSVSTPIALLHAGSASGWAVALAILTMPIAAAVTVAGCVAMAVGLAFPHAASPAGWIAARAAEMLRWVADRSSDLPGSTWWIGTVPGWWSIATLACVAASWTMRSPDARRAARWSIIALATVAWTGDARMHAGGEGDGEVEIVHLRLGQSTCSLVRGHGRAVLVDPGSAMDPSAGSRLVVPALAELGVRRLDAVVVTDARIAHMSALPEVLGAWSPRTIVVTAHGGDRAESLSRGEGRRGPWGEVLDLAIASGTEVRTVAQDGERGSPDSAWSFALEHLQPGDDALELLESSAAVRVVEGPGDRRELFTWVDHGWAPAVTTTARRSSTQSPARLPSSERITSSKGAAARSARSSKVVSPGPIR